MLLSFPPGDATWVNSQKSSQSLTGQTEPCPVSLQPLGQGLQLALINGVVAKKLNDAGHKANRRDDSPVFPVVDSSFINVQLPSKLLLLKA